MTEQQRSKREQLSSIDSIAVKFVVDGDVRFIGKVWDKSDTGVKILVHTKNLFLKPETWGILTLTERGKSTEYWGGVMWVDWVFASSSYWVGMRYMKK